MTRCTLIVTGAPLAARTSDIVSTLQEAALDVDLVSTPSAEQWMDIDQAAALTGAVSRISQRHVDGAKRHPLPEVAVVCPATFNTISKAALGIADTHAHSFLCECIGAGVPLLIVPMINTRLWNHPARSAHFSLLTDAGAMFVDARTGDVGTSEIPSGTGAEVVQAFQPAWILRHLAALLAETWSR
jgi:phosphopantothenoylcysteine synthetase/decarboxylase